MTSELFNHFIPRLEHGDRPYQIWKSLKYLNLYRVILSGIFVSCIFFTRNLPLLGSHDHQLYTIASYAYLLISVSSNFAIHAKWPSFETLVLNLTLSDITVLTLVMHASGGVETGLGMLVLVAIAGNSMLIAGRTANLFAALGALAILTEQIVAHIDSTITTNYTQAGILGAALFATASLSHSLSKRLRETEALAARRGIDLANLEQLNEYVIKRLQSGVMVVDPHNQIRLMNRSARQMLGLTSTQRNDDFALDTVSPELAEQLLCWRHNSIHKTSLFRCAGMAIDVLPTFQQLGNDKQSGTLIFLEDAARMSQQAQQMKLASLGRLTASIAHEIRNPLGAISHAEQLLAESDNLDNADRRLTEIIHSHTQRVNGIIENVLQLSRRGTNMPELIQLHQWLNRFVEELQMSLKVQAGDIEFTVTPLDLRIFIDPTQLHQVLWNLSQNGLRFSAGYAGQPKLQLRAAVLESTGRPYLDVIDHGPGVPPEVAQHIFEPFFTTDAKGSGLGLYIARELCELNNAYLHHLPVPTGGSCFRIEFASIEPHEPA